MINSIRNITLTVDEIAFWYIILVGVLSYNITIPAIIASFLALPSVIIIPCLFGKVIIRISKMLSRVSILRLLTETFTDIIPCDSISFYTISWMLGSHVMATMFLILTFLHLPNMVKILPILILVLIASNLIYERYELCGNDLYNFCQKFKNNIRFYLSWIVVITIALTAIGLTKTLQPFPFPWGRNYYLLPWNVQCAYRVVESGWFTGGRWPDWLFPAVSLSLFNVEPMDFTWSASFILSAIYASGIFILSRKISRNLGIAVLSGVFGVFINSSPISIDQLMPYRSAAIMYAIFPFVLYTIYQKIGIRKYRLQNVMKTVIMLGLSLTFSFSIIKCVYAWERTLAYTLFFESTLLPILMIILPLIGIPFSLLLKDESIKSLFVLVFLCSAIFFFMHMDESLLFTYAMILFVAVCQLMKGRFGRPLMLTVALVTSASICLQWLNILNIDVSNPISRFLYPVWFSSTPKDIFDIKKVDFAFAYRDIILALAALGCIFALTSKKEQDKVVVSMLFITLLVFFSPEYPTIRAYKQLAPFMAYILSTAFSSIHNRISLLFNRIKHPNLNKSVSVLVIAVTLAAITQPLVSPIYELSLKLSSPQDPYSYCSIAKYEYEAADWIKTNLPETTIIISDYRTMIILNSLGNKIWLVHKGMSATELVPESQQVMYAIKFNVFKANSSEESYYNIMNLLPFISAKEMAYMKYIGASQKELTPVVVVSSRTMKWIEQEGMADIVHAQYSEVPVEYLSLFSDERYFELIYTIGNYLYVYRCNPSS